MRKEWKFNVKNHVVKIVNTWFSGVKLYIDGDLRDTDASFHANGKTVLLSANLSEHGILEISPKSKLISVEIDAHLIVNNVSHVVFSSHKRLSLTEQRTVK